MSGTIKGITIEIEGKTTGIDRAFKKINSEASAVQKELNGVSKLLKMSPGNTDLIRQKQKLLAKQIQTTKTKLKDLKSAQAQLDAKGIDENSAEYRNLQREIVSTENKLKGLEKEQLQFAAQSSKLGQVSEKLKSIGSKATAAGRKLSTTASIAGVAMIAAGKKLLESYSTQSQAETKLEEIYKTRLGTTKKAAKATEKYAAKLQKTGVVGDEVTLSGAQQLATFAKMPGTVNTLMSSMDNLLVQQKGYNATADDARSVANLMGKALNGQTGALTRVGITFTDAQAKVLKYGTEEERASMLSEVITDNVGHMNKAFAKTDEGKIKQAKNTLGDLAEQLGGLLLPVLADIAKYLSSKVVPKLQAMINVAKKHPVIAKIAVAIAAILAVGGPLLILFGAVATGLSSIIGLFSKSAAAADVSAAATSRLTLAERIHAIAQKAQAAAAKIGAVAQRIFNAAMSANPILIVIAAIAALIAIFVLLYKKSETVRNAVNAVWNKMKEFVSIGKEIGTKVAAGIKKAFGALTGAGKLIIEKVTGGIKAVWNGIKTVGRTVAKYFIAGVKLLASGILALGKWYITTQIRGIKIIWNKIKDIGKTVGGLFIKGVKAIWNDLKKAGGWLVKGLWNGITGKVSWIVDKIKGFGSKIITALKKVFDQHSPSKVTRKIGAYLSEGLGLGITDKAAQAIGKAKKMASSVSEAISTSSAADMAAGARTSIKNAASVLTSSPASVNTGIGDDIASAIGTSLALAGSGMSAPAKMTLTINLGGAKVAEQIVKLYDGGKKALGK